MQAHLRRIRLSHKKAQIVAGIIRNKPALEALEMLPFIQNKAAGPLYKCLKSAVSNAENNDGADPATLVVDRVIVNQGSSLRRFLPSTRGRALPLRKPTSHISVFLSPAQS